MNLISMTGLSKKYGQKDATTVALQDINLEIKKGDSIAIMGPSGSGKSTLMNIIGLLDRPTEGTYMLQGKDVSDLKESQLASIRSSKIGFVFQNFNLLQRHTALENVALPMLYAGVRKTTTRLTRAARLLEQVGLEDRMYHLPNELSGGQMQRVAIARALANKPSIILADEPTGNLDTESGQQIMELLSKLNKEGNTIIMVTHDEAVAAHAQRVVRLVDGHITDSSSSSKDKASSARSPKPAAKTSSKKKKSKTKAKAGAEESKS